jgi:hypothetical protein
MTGTLFSPSPQQLPVEHKKRNTSHPIFRFPPLCITFLIITVISLSLPVYPYGIPGDHPAVPHDILGVPPVYLDDIPVYPPAALVGIPDAFPLILPLPMQ